MARKPTLRPVFRAGLVLALVCGGLAACAPWPREVVEASAPGGRTVASSCLFNGHVPEGVAVSAGDVELQVSARPAVQRDGTSPAGDLELELRLEVPAGVTVRFAQRPLKVEVAGPVHRTQATFLSVGRVASPLQRPPPQALAGPVEQGLEMPLVGATRSVASGPSGRLFWLATRLETHAAAAVELRLPTLQVDGRAWQPPPITLRRRLVMGVALLNC